MLIDDLRRCYSLLDCNCCNCSISHCPNYTLCCIILSEIEEQEQILTRTEDEE